MTGPHTAAPGGSSPAATGARRSWTRPLLVTAIVVATILLLTLRFFPTREWLDQRDALAESAAELDELEAERIELEARVAELGTDEEIERIARSEYGLVRPGEEAYAVLPPPPEPVRLPPLWPFGTVTP